MTSRDVLIFYNEPLLPADHPDWASEAGVLESVEATEAVLHKAGHRTRRYGVRQPAKAVLADLTALPAPDVVVNFCEGLGGVGQGEAQLTGIIELLGWPMTGCPADCLTLVRNKPRTKWLLSGAGLPTAEFCLLGGDRLSLGIDDATSKRLEQLLTAGPLIVKPAYEDASLGIGPDSVVQNAQRLHEQIAEIHRRYDSVLVERFIDGREFNVAVVALPQPETLPLAEIEFDAAALGGWAVVTYDAKWNIGSAADLATSARCPAVVDEPIAEELRRLALAAFQATGCRDYARVDFRLSRDGRPFILEVNANCDLGPTAGFARALRASRWGYDGFIAAMVEEARIGEAI